MIIQIEDRFLLSASREVTWEFLIDPRTWVVCMPGAEKMEVLGARDYRGVIKQKIGPMWGTFAVHATLSETAPPRHMKAVGRGSDNGMFGSFSFESTVDINEAAGNQVEIAYNVVVEMPGGVPVVGKMIVEAKAKSLQKELTNNMKQYLEKSRGCASTAQPTP